MSVTVDRAGNGSFVVDTKEVAGEYFEIVLPSSSTSKDPIIVLWNKKISIDDVRAFLLAF